jgi:DNA invertase Pin-like site-specific DNA recombinase
MTVIRAAIYARVSSTRQKNNTSIETQLTDCRAHAERLGWVVVGEYCDVAQSGRKDERPALEQLKADVTARRIDAVLVYKLDRLSRRTAAALDLIDRHFKHVLFESATESLDRYTSGGKFSIAIAAAVAQLQSDQLGERIRRARRYRAEQGRWSGGNPPFGYRIADGGALEPTDDAPTVRLIYDLYATGRYGTRALADELNRRGLTMRDPASGARYPFGMSTVRVILAAPAYAGYISSGDNLFPGLHEPLVDQEIWDAAQAIRVSHDRGGSRAVTHPTALLSGVVRCACCDGRMWAHSVRARALRGHAERRIYWYYRCMSVQQRTCTALMSRMAPVDGAVAALISALSLPDEVFAIARDRLARPVPVVSGPDPAQVRAQMDRLTEMYIAGRLERADYDARYTTLAESLRVAPAPDRLDYDAALAALRDLPRMYATASPEDQRELIQILFDTIWIAPGASIAAIRPHRVMAEALHAVVCGLHSSSPASTVHTTLILPPMWRAHRTPFEFAAR